MSTGGLVAGRLNRTALAVLRTTTKLRASELIPEAGPEFQPDSPGPFAPRDQENSGISVSCTDRFAALSLEFSQFTNRTNIPQPRFPPEARRRADGREMVTTTHVSSAASPS